MKAPVCYRFQCPRYLTCALSGGTACAIERDPTVKEEIPDGACTPQKGYPCYQPGKGANPVHAWMRDPYHR